MWALLISYFVLFSLVPTFYEISRYKDLHDNRYFELVHNFYTDYNFYLSRIRQGREGAWLAKEKYTSEPHKASLLQVMYVLMGKVSAWVHVPWPNSGDTYHVARVVLAFTLLCVVAYVAKTVFKNPFWQVLSFLLVVTAGTWPILQYHKEEWRFGGYMPWWTIMDVLQRITFIPHMLAGQALIVFQLIAIATVTTMKRTGNWIFLGFIALLLGIIFPPGLLFVFAAYGVYVVIDLIYSLPLKTKTEWKDWAVVRLLGPGIVGLISAPSLLYLSLVLRIYPWKRLVDFSVLHPQPFKLTEYILVLGPMLPLGILGAILVLINREKKMLLFVSWTIAWAALIIIFQYVPQESPLRFTEMMPHVPLGILTAYFFYKLYVVGRATKEYMLSKFMKFVSLGIPIFLVILAQGQMYGSWRWQKEFVDHKIIATNPLVPTGSYVMYPLKDFFNAILFIQDSTPRSTVILSETTAGNYIPVYAGNTVYVGHANTVNTEQKEFIVADFFSGRMGRTKAKEFLIANNLHWIFFGPQEMDDGGILDLSRVYPFLKEVYQNPSVRIYTW
jgi:hypothetical protein